MDDAPPNEVKQFAARFGINYSIVMGSREIVSEYGGVPALPTCFVIGPDGRVVPELSLAPVVAGLDRVIDAFTAAQMLREQYMCHAAILESDTKPVSGVANGG